MRNSLPLRQQQRKAAKSGRGSSSETDLPRVIWVGRRKQTCRLSSGDIASAIPNCPIFRALALRAAVGAVTHAGAAVCSRATLQERVDATLASFVGNVFGRRTRLRHGV